MSLLDLIHRASCAPATRRSHAADSLAVPQAPPPSRRLQAAAFSPAAAPATASAVWRGGRGWSSIAARLPARLARPSIQLSWRRKGLTPAISRRASGLTINHKKCASRARLHRLVRRRCRKDAIQCERRKADTFSTPLYVSLAGLSFILLFVEELLDLRKHSVWISHQNNMVCVWKNRQL